MTWEQFKGTLAFWPTIIVGVCVAAVLTPIVLFLGAFAILIFWPLIVAGGVMITLYSLYLLWYIKRGDK